MFGIGVVAHLARADQAHALMEKAGAAYLSMDDGSLGCSRNHRKVWAWLAEHGEREGHDHALVLEDDALPVDGLRDQLTQALSVAPSPIVSLYLGQGHPRQWQRRVGQAIHTAQQDNAHWIVGKRLLHGVAICIRTELIPAMLTHITPSRRPIDQAIRDWAVDEGHDIAFTYPSLVDHADTPTLITNRAQRTEQRTAWRAGTRDRWTRKAVPL